MSLLKVQLNICTKATLRADESGCCGVVGGGGGAGRKQFFGEYMFIVLSLCLPYVQDCPFDFDQKANDV